jgi:hypothetical protein
MPRKTSISTRPGCRALEDRRREQEHRFEIEEDEEHGDVELHRHPIARIAPDRSTFVSFSPIARGMASAYASRAAGGDGAADAMAMA